MSWRRSPAVIARGHQVVDHGFLAPLKRLDEKGLAHLVQICHVASSPKVSWNESPCGDAAVDLVGIHVFAEHDSTCPSPTAGRATRAHVVRHQECEVGRTPIGRQAESMWTRSFASTSTAADEAHIRDRLVEFRIDHRCQQLPDLGVRHRSAWLSGPAVGLRHRRLALLLEARACAFAPGDVDAVEPSGVEAEDLLLGLQRSARRRSPWPRRRATRTP